MRSVRGLACGSFAPMLGKIATALVLVTAVSCASNPGPGKEPAAVGSSSASATAEPAVASTSSARELPATEKVLQFEGYDGPPGDMRELPAAAWTVAPLPDASGSGPCTYSGPTLSREPIVGTQGGRVVLQLSEDPKCRFAVPPALIVPDDTSALKKGQAVLWANKGVVWYARVDSVAGDEVSLLFSHGTSEEMKFGASAFGRVKAKRQDVRAVHDGLEYGSRAALPNGDSLKLGTVFAVTDDAVFVAQPFGTKYAKKEADPLRFVEPVADGAKVGAVRPDGGFVVRGTVRRSLESMIYEIEPKSGVRWTVAFEDLGLLH